MENVEMEGLFGIHARLGFDYWYHSLNTKSINSSPVLILTVLNPLPTVAHEPSSEVGSYTNIKEKGE
jgi:hypothetical protein